MLAPSRGFLAGFDDACNTRRTHKKKENKYLWVKIGGDTHGWTQIKMSKEIVVLWADNGYWCAVNKNPMISAAELICYFLPGSTTHRLNNGGWCVAVVNTSVQRHLPLRWACVKGKLRIRPDPIFPILSAGHVWKTAVNSDQLHMLCGGWLPSSTQGSCCLQVATKHDIRHLNEDEQLQQSHPTCCMALDGCSKNWIGP